MKKSLLSLALAFMLILGCSFPAKADSGSNFGAGTIKAGTAGYGVIDGAKNDKFYHLTPGRASIYVGSHSGKIQVTLREGYFSVSATTIDTVDIDDGNGWYTFNGLTKDSQYYSLFITYYGASGTSGSISGSVHDHAGQ